MSERRDDTPEPTPAPRPAEPEREPGSYYYDDGTGYEIYHPEEDHEECDDASQPPPHVSSPASGRRPGAIAEPAVGAAGMGNS